MLNSVLDGSGRIATWFARAASLGVAWMMGVTLIDVIGRSGFNSPIIGSIELIETVLGMTVFLGMGYVTFDRSHITVDFLVTMLPPRVRAALQVLTGLICSVFIGFATWRMILQVEGRVIESLHTTLWLIPMWPVTLVMTLGLALMFVMLLLQLIQDIGKVSSAEVQLDAKPAGSETTSIE